MYLFKAFNDNLLFHGSHQRYEFTYWEMNGQFIEVIGNLSLIGHLSIVIKVFRTINLDRRCFIDVIVKVIMGTYHFLLTFVDFFK